MRMSMMLNKNTSYWLRGDLKHLMKNVVFLMELVDVKPLKN